MNKSDPKNLDASEPAGTSGKAATTFGHVPVSGPSGRNVFPYPDYQTVLLQGLESGAGTFEFVSPPPRVPGALNSTGGDKKDSLVFQLQNLINDRTRKIEGRSFISLHVGGRFHVRARLEPLTNESSSGELYRLHVKDTLATPPKKFSIVLAQARTTGSDGLLRAGEIREASRTMDLHQKLNANTSSASTEPIILCRTGNDHGATLNVYRTLSARIAEGVISTPEELKKALNSIILQGREARGPLSVGSNTQVQELARTLLADLGQSRKTAAPVTTPAADDTKIALALQTGAERIRLTTGGKAFDASRFTLRDNLGQGNCLFHALEGTKESPNLTPWELDTIRGKVADVLLSKPEQPNINLREYCLTEYPNREAPAGLEVSNRMMADLQRTLGKVAGDIEIAQWLELPNNRHKKVVVIDSLAGSESIITFTQNERVAWTLRGQTPPLSEDEANRLIKEKIATALKEESEATEPSERTQIALYRTINHWQAIAGVPDDQRSAGPVRDHTLPAKEGSQERKPGTAT